MTPGEAGTVTSPRGTSASRCHQVQLVDGHSAALTRSPGTAEPAGRNRYCCAYIPLAARGLGTGINMTVDPDDPDIFDFAVST